MKKERVKRRRSISGTIGYIAGLFIGLLAIAVVTMFLAALVVFIGNIFTAVLMPGATIVYNAISAFLSKFSFVLFMILIFAIGLVCIDGIIKEADSRS